MMHIIRSVEVHLVSIRSVVRSSVHERNGVRARSSADGWHQSSDIVHWRCFVFLVRLGDKS